MDFPTLSSVSVTEHQKNKMDNSWECGVWHAPLMELKDPQYNRDEYSTGTSFILDEFLLGSVSSPGDIVNDTVEIMTPNYMVGELID